MKKAIEMNDLMEKKLSVEELEMVSGGVEEEEPDGIVSLLVILGMTLLAGVIVWGLIVLLAWIIVNDGMITAAISAMDKKAGEQYRRLSKSEKKKLWTEAYHKIR